MKARGGLGDRAAIWAKLGMEDGFAGDMTRADGIRRSFPR
jgi:hypothetical protein